MSVDNVTPRVRNPRVQRRDRPWIGAMVSTLVGPCDMPSVADLERAVVTLSQRFPHCRLGWGLDDPKRHWVIPTGPGGGKLGAVVVERSRAGHADLGETLDSMVSDSRVDAPLTLFRFEEHFGLRMSHEYGDGRFYDEAIGALMTVAAGGSESWNMGPTNRFPLTTALARTFGSDPRRVLAAVADRPQRVVPVASSTPVPWTRARRTCAAVIPNELREQMIDWGRTAAPGASWFSLLVSMLLRSMEVAGMRVSDDVAIVMDLRRFLRSRGLDGNFVIGVPFAITYRTSPETIGTMIRSAVTSGRPVAAQAAAALRGWRGGSAPVSFDATRLPRVTFTSVGAPPRMNSLSFRPGEPAVVSGSVEPEGPHGLTFLVSETPDTCAVTASFHENVIDAELVTEALRLAQTEPLEILTKW
jgi:hypothetical protein